MLPAPGRLVGAYELVEPLGKGGMGEVYRARDTRLGRSVAIKFVSAHLKNDGIAIERLGREARLASSLNHPGIVTVYDVGQDEGRPFVVMEFIGGGSLAARLVSGPMTMSEAVSIAAQVAEGLAVAHDAGIVHRDLKPQNIMLTPDGRAKIVDFGLSKLSVEHAGEDDETRMEQPLTADRTLIGTAGYMSPEQVAGKPADARTDQFALGAILYEMLTGRRAFRRDTAVQTMSSIIDDEPAPVDVLCPGVTGPVARIIARCLAKRPEGRYASTRDLARDLSEACEPKSSSSHAIARAASPSRRWTLLALGAAALVIAVGGYLWPRGAPGARAQTTLRAPALRQIAVLPLVNVTKEPLDQVFADGLVETLSSSLTQLERFQQSLRVVPATEVRSQRVASAADARRAFGATLAISGSIQRADGTVRLTLNLIDAGQLVQVASRTIEFSGGLDRASEAAVVGVTTSLLDLELAPDARVALTAGGTAAPEAYAHFVRGRGYLQRFDRGVENIDRAIESLTRAVAADPHYALALASLGEAYWRKYELDRQSRWIDLAVERCEAALTVDNRLAPVHVTLAMVARGRGRYEESLVYAQRAVELDPASGDGYRELARAFDALNRPADAEATYRKALAARPDDWMAYNALGTFLLSKGRLADAESAYRRVMDLTPDNTRAYNNLGATYFKMGRRADAAAMWERSVSLRPTYSAESNLGTYYFSEQRYTDAARAFERAVELSPNDPDVWRNLGAARFWAPGERARSAEAYEKAVQLGEEARRVNPRRPSLLAALADAYSMLGRRDEARESAVAVERLGSTDPVDLFNVASAYEQIGDRTLALGWLDKAMKAGFAREAIEASPGLAELRRDNRYGHLGQAER
jgi:serine/threonine-protein kinase